MNSNSIIAQGNQTSPLGKIVAGCRFQTYYPITPATDDSEYLESNQILDQNDKNSGSVVVIQTEDEIAAITMAIGAALTGRTSLHYYLRARLFTYGRSIRMGRNK